MARDRTALTWALGCSLLLHGGVIGLVGQRGGGGAPPHAVAIEARLSGGSPLGQPVPAEAPEAVAQPDAARLAMESAEPGDVGAVEQRDTKQRKDQPDGPASPAANVLPADDEPATLLYLRGAQLHQRPIPLMRVELADLAREFPGARAGFDVRVNVHGTVDSVDILLDSDPALAKVYRQRLERLQFVPGKVTGVAVPAALTIEVNLPPAAIPLARSAEQEAQNHRQ